MNTGIICMLLQIVMLIGVLVGKALDLSMWVNLFFVGGITIFLYHTTWMVRTGGRG